LKASISSAGRSCSKKIEESTETVLARLSKTKTNAEFLKLIAR
jgi:transcription termination factor Rho